MALENPLHALDVASLDRIKPRIPWNVRDFDGHRIRNEHEQALAERDNQLLEWLQVLRGSAIANVSPRYPFKEDASLVPSTVEILDFSGDPLADFVVSLDGKQLPLSFIKDLKLILTSDFSDPYVSRISFREQTDPASNLIQVFIDIEISARLRSDQMIYPILRLVNKAYNDVQDNTQPSSRDNRSFLMESLEVNGRSYFNSGVLEFAFLGSIQSQTESSWSIGEYQGQEVEGFSIVQDLQTIHFDFDFQATKLTQLAYNNLGDITDSVPFLRKVQNFPFMREANAGNILAQFFTDLKISGPAGQLLYIRRIRRFNDPVRGVVYRVLFSYDNINDQEVNLGRINIGVADIWNRSSGNWIFPIRSLGSNTLPGEAPNWRDEQLSTSKDSYGAGLIRIINFAAMSDLFTDLIAAGNSLDPVTPQDQTLAPPPTIGEFPDPDRVVFVRGNTLIEPIAVDSVARPTVVTEVPVDPQIHQTRNVRVVIDGVRVTRRIAYGNESQMRNFYGLTGAESLIDNPNIDPEDEWFDTSANSLKRYQRLQGRLVWRAV